MRTFCDTAKPTCWSLTMITCRIMQGHQHYYANYVRANLAHTHRDTYLTKHTSTRSLLSLDCAHMSVPSMIECLPHIMIDCYSFKLVFYWSVYHCLSMISFAVLTQLSQHQSSNISTAILGNAFCMFRMKLEVKQSNFQASNSTDTNTHKSTSSGGSLPFIYIIFILLNYI